MSDLRKAAEMALEVFDGPVLKDATEHAMRLRKACDLLRQALAQPEQKREWVGLTEEQIFDEAEKFGSFEYGDAQGHKRLGFARAIEAKLKEKNFG